MTTLRTIYLENNLGTKTFDFVDEGAFTTENAWNSGVPRELNSRTVSSTIQPLIPHETIVETLSVYAAADGDNDDAILSQWATILELKEIARKYRELPSYSDFVWLYVKKNGIIRRCYVYMIDIVLPADATNPLNDNGVWHFVVSMLRHPYWEDLDESQIELNPGTWHGKEKSMGGGQAIGRVTQLETYGSLQSSDHTGFYAGFKTGDGDGFMHYWDAENATALGADASVQALAGSRSGDAVRVTFATDESMVERAELTLETEAVAQGISTSSEILQNNRGQYLLLLRYYATGATSSYAIRHALGSTDGLDKIQGNITYIDGEATPILRLIPMGVVSLPWFMGKMDLGTHSSDNIFGDLAISIFAERYSGSGQLWFDGIYFIPYETHLQASDFIVGTTDALTEIQTLPNDKMEGAAMRTGVGEGIDGPITIVPKNWGVPSEPGWFVMVLDDDGSGGSPATMDLDTILRYHRRYLYF